MKFLEQVLGLMRWKRLILLNTALFAAASVVVALLLPKWYRSTASVFPPEEDTMSTASLGSLISVAALGRSRASLPVWATTSDVYAAVLESRTVREEIVRRFDLTSVYKVKDVDHALKALRQNVSVEVGGEGVIYLEILDKDPARAAEMANAFVEIMDRVNKEKRHSSARQARLFIERRLEENRRDLGKAEESLRALQESTGVLIPEEQLQAIIQAAAEVQVQLLLKEVELAVLEAQVGPEHPERESLRREVLALRDRVALLEEGSESPSPAGAPSPKERGSLDLPLREYPGVAMAYLRAIRELKVQEAIFELLMEQYERYRIQEMRDTPTVQVLDEAVPATVKAKPIRWLICLIATFLAFGVSVGMAVLLETVARIKREDPARYERFLALARELHLTFLLDRL